MTDNDNLPPPSARQDKREDAEEEAAPPPPTDSNPVRSEDGKEDGSAYEQHEQQQQEDMEEGGRPSWISELHAAWDEEIDNMPDHKKQFFFQFPDSSSASEGEEGDEDEEAEEDSGGYGEGEEEPGAGAGGRNRGRRRKNRKIRKHMKQFIKRAYNEDGGGAQWQDSATAQPQQQQPQQTQQHPHRSRYFFGADAAWQQTPQDKDGDRFSRPSEESTSAATTGGSGPSRKAKQDAVRQQKNVSKQWSYEQKLRRYHENISELKQERKYQQRRYKSRRRRENSLDLDHDNLSMSDDEGVDSGDEADLDTNVDAQESAEDEYDLASDIVAESQTTRSRSDSLDTIDTNDTHDAHDTYDNGNLRARSDSMDSHDSGSEAATMSSSSHMSSLPAPLASSPTGIDSSLIEKAGAIVSRRRRQGLLQRIFAGNQKTSSLKKEQEIRDDLTRYEAKLRKNLVECRIVLKELRRNERTLTHNIHQEMVFLKKSALVNLVPIFRRLSATKIVRVRERLKLEKGCHALIKERIALVSHALKFTSEEGNTPQNSRDAEMENGIMSLPAYVNDEFFLDVDDMVMASPTLFILWKRIKCLDSKAKLDSEMYLSTRRAMIKPMPKKEIGQKVLKLLKNYDIPFNPDKPFVDSFECNIQSRFATLISDQRTNEGKSIRTFLKELQSYGLERVPPSEITGYIESYVSFLVKSHRIVDPHIPNPDDDSYNEMNSSITNRLHTLVDQYIFNLIGLDLQRIEWDNSDQDDSHFLAQSHILRKLTPVQLGVDTNFLSYQSNEMPFAESIDILGYLGFCTTPREMLHCVHCCAKAIHRDAHKSCKEREKDFSFGADEFFPILVYVMVQSELPMAHSNLSYLSKFTSNQSSSELIYYLTCLEGALMYIAGLDEEEIDNLTSMRKKEERQEEPPMSELPRTEENEYGTCDDEEEKKSTPPQDLPSSEVASEVQQ